MVGQARGRSKVYLAFGVVAAFVALIGFAKTFFHPLLTGTFQAPLVVYLHGVCLFGWVAFFCVQSLLIQRREIALHRRLGWWGCGLAAGVIITTLCVGVLASRRALAGGAAEIASAELLVIIMEMAVFAALVVAPVLQRRRPEVHKRLMLLALLGALGPAWFRFRHYFPAIDNPVFFYSLLLADSLIVIAIIADFVRERRVHWVYPVVGGAMVVVHLIEVFAFETRPFQAVASVLAGPLL